MKHSIIVWCTAILLAWLPAPARGSVPPRAVDGATVVSETTLDARTRDLVVQSPALGRTAHVRLVLPDGWSPAASRTWPMLWLLHGGGGGYTDWTANTDVEQLSAGRQLILVMPEGGPCGNYTDWYNGGSYGPPAWETFHLTELWQILRTGYRAGPSAAVAGPSMGGFGAMSYAARHPGVFAGAASFSGMLDSLLADHLPSGPLFVKTFTAVGCPGTDPDDIWGDDRAQRAIWQAHNPTSLAARLRGTALYVASGNGLPGPLDSLPVPDLVFEPQALAESRSFQRALAAASVPATFDLYGNGTHSWPYWQRELHRAFPLLTAAIGA
jgi:S-formylglutathione hydrolase FrmB